MLKCSRCRHVFPAPRAKKQAPLIERPETPALSGDENLTLPFDEAAWKDEAEAPHADDLTVAEADERFTLGTEAEDEALTIPALDPPPPPVATVKVRRPRAVRAQDDADSSDDDQPRNSERGKVSAIFVFLAIVVASYAVVTRALFASPALCDRIVGRLPLIGTLGDDRLLTRKVALSEVVGSYQRIKDGKDVFVISGRALNTAPVALHGVQVVGKLFDGNGQVLDQKVIYCGNVISVKVLKDLTQRELSILQLNPQTKRFVIEPGESSRFVIVFMDPPRGAGEFSTQVAAAQRQA